MKKMMTKNIAEALEEIIEYVRTIAMLFIPISTMMHKK